MLKDMGGGSMNEKKDKYIKDTLSNSNKLKRVYEFLIMQDNSNYFTKDVFDNKKFKVLSKDNNDSIDLAQIYK